jgi:regulator of cell morphogenesis and NO signaling
MVTYITGNELLGEVILKYPVTSQLMRGYKIDFYCGGQRMLSRVIAEHSLDEATFLSRLNQVVDREMALRHKEMDWEAMPVDEMMDYIVQNHHAFLKDRLPALGELIYHMMRDKGEKYPELYELYTVFHVLKSELESHIQKEEKRIFPHLQWVAQGVFSLDELHERPELADMEAENLIAGEALKRIRALTHDYELPEGACRTYAITLKKLEALEHDLLRHIHLENHVLFPRVMSHSAP